MKIGIDIRPLSAPRTGIGRYLTRMLEEFYRNDSQNEYTLMYRKGAIPPDIPNGGNFRIVSPSLPNKFLNILWAFSSFPVVERFVGEIDVFHSANFQVPPTINAARVVTVHDLVFFAHPELAIPSAVRHFKPRIRHYIDRADLIIVDSKATAGDVTNYLDVPENKVIVVYCGTTVMEKSSQKIVTEVKTRHKINGAYILFVGCLEPRKNLPRLFKAFELSGLAGDFELVLVGPLGWHTEELFKVWRSLICKDRIRWLNYVNDMDLAPLYSGATYFAYPSIMEGFGLPILEAMSAGCPVLTSNISSMPEVAGEAAVYVDPCDIDSIVEGLRKLAYDDSLRAKLSELGLKRTALFTWQNTACQMIKVYERAGRLNSSKPI